MHNTIPLSEFKFRDNDSGRVRESIVTVGLHDSKGSMIFGGGLRKLNAKLPPTVSTFSAVSTDRFPAFYKSLGVMTSEGCKE